MIIVLVLVLGCDGPETNDAGSRDAGATVDSSVGPVCDGGLDAGPSSRGVTRGCSGGVVASGFTLRLGAGAEPISRLGAFLRPEPPESCEPGAALSRVTLITEIDSRLEEGTALVTYHVLAEPSARPPDAGASWSGVRIARGRVGIDMDSALGTTVTSPVLFDLSLVGLESAPTIVVVLDGFEIDTDVPQATGYPAEHLPADGYPLLRLGARLDAPTRTGVDLRFEASATLEFGRAGSSVEARAAMIARSRMVLHYSVIGLVEEPPTAHISYRNDCRPDAAMTALEIIGPVGARAVPALTAFELDVRPGSPEDGVRVRELTVRVDGFTYDTATGRASMDVIGFLEGADDASVETQFEADVALIGWSGAESVESLRYVDTVASGHAETSLPLGP